MQPTFLAAMCVNRTVFEALESQLRNLDPLDQAIITAIDGYYRRDHSAFYVDFDILEQLATANVASAKHREELKARISILRGVAPDVSDVNVKEVARAWKRAALGREIATQIASTNGRDVAALMEEYLSTMIDEEKEERLTFDDVFSELSDPTTALPIGPNALNAMLDGGAHGGDHVGIFGRSNAGKSLVSIDIACRLAKKGKRGIYLENEDRIVRTTRRFWTNLADMTKEEIIENPSEAKRRVRDSGIENLLIRDIAPGTVGQITSLVRNWKPDFIIVNQIRNLSIGGVSSMTEKLERAAIAMRNLCKRENIVTFSVTQAGDSATNKLILDQSDIDSSKTGLVAQLDVLLGVGVDQSFEENNQRCLSLGKNKLGGDIGHIVVKVDKQKSKIIGE